MRAVGEEPPKETSPSTSASLSSPPNLPQASDYRRPTHGFISHTTWLWRRGRIGEEEGEEKQRRKEREDDKKEERRTYHQGTPGKAQQRSRRSQYPTRCLVLPKALPGKAKECQYRVR